MEKEDNAERISFAQKYANLIGEGIPKTQLPVMIPDKCRRQFIHPENGFVKKYCLYDGKDTKVLKRVKK